MAETGNNASDLRASLLIYDIPERSGVANPSGFLRRMAVRVNLSCWVIPEGDIPYHRLHAMATGGATWHVVRFDAAEAWKLVGMAAAAIRRELRDALRRARRAAGRAAAAVEAGESDPGRYDERARSTVRRLRRLLSDLTAAAGRFGIAAEGLPLLAAARGIDALQAAMKARARLYAEAAEAVRRLGDEAMARAAEADLVPAGVLADDIDDRGGDTSALRAAFDPAT